MHSRRPEEYAAACTATALHRLAAPGSLPQPRVPSRNAQALWHIDPMSAADVAVVEQPAEQPVADQPTSEKGVGTADEPLGDDSSAFECNICLELAKEPVVTLCGHLYCWPCLYRWIQVRGCPRACPVCKAGVDVDKVIPIYGRACDFDPRTEAVKVQPVPPRPAGQRPPAVQPSPAGPPQPGGLLAFSGFQLGPGQGYVEALTPEQQHQAFLSRLLLMLGSFVIMCLLLF